MPKSAQGTFLLPPSHDHHKTRDRRARKPSSHAIDPPLPPSSTPRISCASAIASHIRLRASTHWRMSLTSLVSPQFPRPAGLSMPTPKTYPASPPPASARTVLPPALPPPWDGLTRSRLSPGDLTRPPLPLPLQLSQRTTKPLRHGSPPTAAAQARLHSWLSALPVPLSNRPPLPLNRSRLTTAGATRQLPKLSTRAALLLPALPASLVATQRPPRLSTATDTRLSNLSRNLQPPSLLSSARLPRRRAPWLRPEATLDAPALRRKIPTLWKRAQLPVLSTVLP